MSYRKVIQSCLDEIEDNLQTEMTVQELAAHAGFSLYHFYRVFHSYLGMPVMQYVQRRRLLHAIYEVRNGEKRIDAALKYGFDTYAGFYKAFHREYGCTPSAYLRKNRAKRPVRPNLLKEENTMSLTHKQAQEALVHWGMENESIRPLYDESSGHLLERAVLVGEDYVLRCAPERSELENGLSIAGELKNVGVDTQTPVSAMNGEQIVRQGKFWYVLCRRTQGKEVIAADLYGADGETQARFVGEVIGQMHLTLAKMDMKLQQADLLSTVRDWALPNAKEILGLSDEFATQYLTEFENLFSHLPKQIIHRNPHPGAILTAEDAWGMIDFDMAERNVRLFDPCYAATAILSESFEEGNAQKFQKWVALYQNILQGYDSVIQLTEEEKRAAPLVLLANQFVCVAWFRQQDKYPDVFAINCAMTKTLLKHMDELKMV